MSNLFATAPSTTSMRRAIAEPQDGIEKITSLDTRQTSGTGVGESSSSSTARKNNSRKTKMPTDYSPHKNTVICGRGKTCTNNPGNVRLRQLIQKKLKQYGKADNKVLKTEIVSSVMDAVRDCCPQGDPAFVKKELDTWWEVDDAFAREKIGCIFRDALYSKYRSSTKSKLARRKQDVLLLQQQVVAAASTSKQLQQQEEQGRNTNNMMRPHLAGLMGASDATLVPPDDMNLSTFTSSGVPPSIYPDTMPCLYGNGGGVTSGFYGASTMSMADNMCAMNNSINSTNSNASGVNGYGMISWPCHTAAGFSANAMGPMGNFGGSGALGALGGGATSDYWSLLNNYLDGQQMPQCFSRGVGASAGGMNMHQHHTNMMYGRSHSNMMMSPFTLSSSRPFPMSSFSLGAMDVSQDTIRSSPRRHETATPSGWNGPRTVTVPATPAPPIGNETNGDHDDDEAEAAAAESSAYKNNDKRSDIERLEEANELASLPDDLSDIFEG